VADELGHLPLALQLASHFLKAYQLTTTAGTYVEELRKEQTLQHASLQGKGSTTSPTAHILHVQQTFATSYRRLEPTDPCDQLARILLKRASYLAPGVPIPTSLLFAKQSQTREEGLQPPTEDEEDDKVWEDALTRLINLGLLETLDNQSVRLHHLLASFVQEQVMPDEVEIQKFVEQVILQKVTEAIDKAAFPAILALQPHFRVVTDRSVNRGDLTAASLCHLLGVCLQMIGAYREAQSYLQHAVHIREQVLGADDPEVGKSLNQLARLYLVQGRYEEAERLFQRAIQILERAAGGEHLEVVECQHNLATLYFEQGRYEEAKVLYQQVISIRERVRGRVHSDVAAKCFQDDYAA